MNNFYTLLAAAGLFGLSGNMPHGIAPLSASVTRPAPARAAAGYYFALRDVPLSQEQYIFQADPLKKAVYVQGDKNIVLSHTMTVRNAKGFDMYFSGEDYNVILALKDAKVVDDATIEYKGTLLIRHSSEKQKFAIHGFQNR